MKTRFLGPARDEFLATVDFYEQRAAGLGNDFIAETEFAIANIAENPHLGVSFIGETRRLLLNRFPYFIIYMIDQNMLIIIAVAHQHQKPGYWKGRI